MSVVVTHRCQSSYRSLSYLFDEPAHSTTKTIRRTLLCSGQNIRLLHDNDGTVTVDQSSAYLARQFKQNLLKAKSPGRKFQAQSIIISFDESEFDTTDLKIQS